MTKSNRAPLIAAAMVITGATAVFGTYANDDATVTTASMQAPTSLTDEQKTGLEQARALFKEGKKDEAKALLDSLGLNKLDGKFMFHEKRNDFLKNLTEEQKAIVEQAHQLMKNGKKDEADALLKANGIQLPERMEIKFNLTEEQKAKLDEAKALREAGKLDEAKAIMDELGLPVMGEFHMGGKMMERMENLTDAQKARLEEAHQLMMKGDEDGAKAIFEEVGVPFPEKHFMKMNLTDEQKAVMEKAHELMKAGDKAGAEKLMTEAGIEMPKGPNMMFFENLTDEQKAGMKKVRELMEAGKKEEAQQLMESLGLPTPPAGKMLKWEEKVEDTTK